MYKFHRILLPSIFSNFFTPVRNVHSYNTRLASKSSFALPSARTNYRIFSLKFRPKAQKKLGILSTSHSNLVASCVPAYLTDPIITPFNYITLNYKVVQLRQALMVFLDVLYLSLFYNSERFEPRCGNVVVWVIVRVCSVVLRTVVGVDWRFDNLSGSHHQSKRL